MPSLRGLALATIFSLVPLAQSSGTVSLPLDKRINTHSGHRISQGHYKRQISTNSTVEETLVDILPWSSGGAYYVSSRLIRQSRRTQYLTHPSHCRHPPSEHHSSA